MNPRHKADGMWKALEFTSRDVYPLRLESEANDFGLDGIHRILPRFLKLATRSSK